MPEDALVQDELGSGELKSIEIAEYGLTVAVYPGVFDPTLGVSSGYLADLITSNDLKDRRVFDVGCGTGILGLLALKKNARSVTFVDIDKFALCNTYKNIVRNRESKRAYLRKTFNPCDSCVTLIFNPPFNNSPRDNLCRTPLLDVDANFLLETMSKFKTCEEGSEIFVAVGFEALNAWMENKLWQGIKWRNKISIATFPGGLFVGQGILER